MTLFQRLGNARGVLEAVEGLARLASVQGHSERAARLFGAAAACRREVGIYAPPSEQASCDSWVAAVRSTLGDEAFERAWVQGQALPLEQASAEARGEQTPP